MTASTTFGLEEIFKQKDRMPCLPDETRMPYRSEGNRQEKAFDTLEWLAAITPYIGLKKSLGEEDIYPGISSISSIIVDKGVLIFVGLRNGNGMI
jgi:hypothetical protein